MRERHFRGHVAGLRMADQRRLVDAKRIHELQDEGSPKADSPVRRIVGEAEAGLVIGDDAQAEVGERREVALKDVRGRTERGAVQQDHCRALPLLEIARA